MVKDDPELNGYLTNLGYKPMLILSHPKYVKELSLSAKSFKKFNLFKHSELSYTRGIFFVEDEHWMQVRSIIRHSFNHEAVKKMIPIMQESIHKYLGKITD